MKNSDFGLIEFALMEFALGNLSSSPCTLKGLPFQKPNFHILVKIEVTVLASKVNIPDFFQLIMKICIKIDFLRP